MSTLDNPYTREAKMAKFDHRVDVRSDVWLRMRGLETKKAKDAGAEEMMEPMATEEKDTKETVYTGEKEDAKETKEAKETMDTKETMNTGAKETKETKEAKEVMDTKETMNTGAKKTKETIWWMEVMATEEKETKGNTTKEPMETMGAMDKGNATKDYRS